MTIGVGDGPKQPPGPKRKGKQLDLAVELGRARELWTQSSQIPGVYMFVCVCVCV